MPDEKPPIAEIFFELLASVSPNGASLAQRLRASDGTGVAVQPGDAEALAQLDRLVEEKTGLKPERGTAIHLSFLK